MTLSDVAARASVSEATASRSLRGGTSVSPATRERVLDAARDLSYVSPLQALSEQQGARRVVAIIVPFVSRWFFGTVTATATDHFRSRGYDVLLHLGSTDDSDDFFGSLPLADKVDGFLVVSMPLKAELAESLRSLNKPLVSVGLPIAGSPSVGIDEVGAARAAVTHLLNLGHERIGLLSGGSDDVASGFGISTARRLGYEEALDGAGIAFDPDLGASGPYGIGGGAVAMSELLSRPSLPTAVFAEYDELAIGALWALRRAGLRVPEDVSVMGLDDHELAPFLDLTTIAQDVEQQARRGARMLMQLLGAEDGTPPDDPVRIPTRLLLRGTTARPPAGHPTRSAREAER